MIDLITGIILGVGTLFAGILGYKYRNVIASLISDADLGTAVEIYRASVEFVTGGDDQIVDPQDAVVFVETIRSILRDEQEELREKD